MSILNVNTIQPVGSGQTITVSATNISAPSTVVTASSFVGSNGVQVGAGKSIRIFGSTSGYSDIIASSAAGASELLLPNTSGTLDRLNRAGNILQVVNGTYSTQTSTTSTSYVDTGLTASITPTSVASKIIILVNHGTIEKNAAANGSGINLQLLRDSTSLCVFGNALGYTNSTLINRCSASVTYLDSPSTTSSVTYKTQFSSNTGSASAMVQVSNTISTITLLEVAA